MRFSCRCEERDPKALNSTEDAHLKSMSIFETDEHLRTSDHHAIARAAFAEAVKWRPGKIASFSRSRECWRTAEDDADAKKTVEGAPLPRCHKNPLS
jgi:hypothetical protein